VQPACPLASRTTKQASDSSTDHGGRKRRAGMTAEQIWCDLLGNGRPQVSGEMDFACVWSGVGSQAEAVDDVLNEVCVLAVQRSRVATARAVLALTCGSASFEAPGSLQYCS
jgi:hypothetical protein